MKKYQYSIIRPGGNDTALVNELIKNSQLKKTINDAIMQQYPTVEQVGFIDVRNGEYRLEMAGGEFCGNATRSAAFLFLNGKSGGINIRVSGVKTPISAGVNKNKTAWTTIPVLSSTSYSNMVNNCYVVQIEGITQLVRFQKNRFNDEQKAKQEAYKIIKNCNTIPAAPAIGVMFVSKENELLTLEPVVWVKSVDTFFYETACASGTAAVGFVEALKQKRSIENFPILQPSKEIITTSTRLIKNKISCKISGTIHVLETDLVVEI